MNESGFKQRLIGAAVLIALAVLFLPAILDGKKAQYFEEELIPPRPEDKLLSELANSLETASQHRKSPENTTTDTSSVEESNETTETTVLTGKETAFIVQVASFADLTNAEKLVARLKGQKLKAYVGREKVIRKGQKLSRVMVGPMLLLADAEAVLNQLKDNKDLKASIVEFDPVKH